MFPESWLFMLVLGREGSSLDEMGMWRDNMKPKQRKTIRLITFSNFDTHTSPLFAKFNLLKLQDYIKLQTLLFMHQFNTGKLPKIFDSFFCQNIL